MSRKALLTGFGIMLLGLPLFVSADAISDLQATIRALQAQIEQIKNSTASGATAQCPDLHRNLQKSMRADDVSKLQQFLSTQYENFTSEYVTGYFGSVTEAAVKQWQCEHDIVCGGSSQSTGYGAVGPMTRRTIAQACSAPSAAPTAPAVTGTTTQSAATPTPAVPSTPAVQPVTSETPTQPAGPAEPTSASSCAWNGQTVASGGSVTAYQAASVAYGSSCASQVRTCSNGTLSGSYQYGSCGVAAPPPISYFSNQTYKIGANFNQYDSCSASGASTPSILLDYAKSGVREKVLALMASMRANGVESLRTMVNFYDGPAGRTDSVVSMSDPVEKATLFANLDAFVRDAKNAGFSRITISFDPLGLGSPLDYVRRWTLPSSCGNSVSGACATPSFDAAYIQKNFDFEMAARSIAKKYETQDFQVLLDLTNEANTSLTSADANARSYVPALWQKYVAAYGSNDAGFTAGLGWYDSATHKPLPNASGFEHLLQAYQASGAGFPKIQMLHDYSFSDTSDDPDLLAVQSLLQKYNVPSESRHIQIAESFYDSPVTATAAYHLKKDEGLALDELLVWPVRVEDVFANACQQDVAPPYSVRLEAAIRANGSPENGYVSRTGYYAPNKEYWTQLSGARNPLVVSVYDANGMVLRSDAPWRWSDDAHTTVAVLATDTEHAALAKGPMQLEIWFDDGSHSPRETVSACGADYALCK